LSKLVIDSDDNISESISYTTRPPRRGEENGIHYHFINSNEFQQMDKANKFIESAEVHGFHYATSAEWVKNSLALGRDLLFILDVIGGTKLKETVDAITIFLVPSDVATLEERLIRRGTDSADVIKRRISSAKQEVIVGIHSYDYIVKNESLEVALGDILSIIRTERIKRRDPKDIIGSLFDK
jgi:guanylate kinase